MVTTSRLFATHLLEMYCASAGHPVPSFLAQAKLRHTSPLACGGMGLLTKSGDKKWGRHGTGIWPFVGGVARLGRALGHGHAHGITRDDSRVAASVP